jgi:hypothetical protein
LVCCGFLPSTVTEKNATKNILDGQTDRGKTEYPPPPSGSGGITKNLTGPKTLHIIWDTYMTLVTKYQISPINSYLEKCDEKYLRRTEGRTDRGKTVYPPSPFGERGYTNFVIYE